MMDHDTFIKELRKPMQVWTLAKAFLRTPNQHVGRSDQGAHKRADNAQDKIDQLVLLRAEVIKHEQVNGKIESGDF